MKKQPTVKKVNATTIIAVIALMIATVSLIWVWRVGEDTRLESAASFQNDMQDTKRHARYEFCHDNNIRPCDDISIKEFNEKIEKEDRFNL